MKKLVKIEEPHYHRLQFNEGSVPSPQICHKCKQPVSRDYYKCERHGFNCEYFLHKECIELKDLPQKHHPLHPQHPLARHDSPWDESFVCGFCRKRRQSRRFYQCIDEQCDFYLDDECDEDFLNRPDLLKEYEIQHFFHDHKNHRLSPYIPFRDKIEYEGYGEKRYEHTVTCAGCKDFICKDQKVYKCIGCPFYLHTECSQVPKEVQHNSHPYHHLVLLQNPPAPDAHRDNSANEVRCTACLKRIENEFYLHCTCCPTFDLDLKCYFELDTEPTIKHEAHEHPLVLIPQILDGNYVRCHACNTPCYHYARRCLSCCNFNIHFDCLALPITVDHDDHVHPLTLTPLFECDHPTAYYCDICEKRRDPDHGLYLCKECPFIAHFECALSLTTAEKKAHAYAPWRQKIKDDNHESDENQEEIFDQLNVEIKKLGEVIQQLIIKKREGEPLTEKIQEFDERHKNTEDMIRRLKQSVKKNYI